MSGFSSVQNAGLGMGGSIFHSAADKAAYQQIIDGKSRGTDLKIKRVKVEIFDLSDAKQVRRYEKLWKSLLEKSSRMEVIVDAHKDLVHRPDGTSYWMKYVEYVEFNNGLQA